MRQLTCSVDVCVGELQDRILAGLLMRGYPGCKLMLDTASRF
ncbi:hypothetical protein MIDIC_140048 [Alphaproteobacteria bacterium]